jgi:hypothetical protein
MVSSIRELRIKRPRGGAEDEAAIGRERDFSIAQNTAKRAGGRREN